PLQVSHAFHSPLMAPMLAEFERAAAQVSYHKPHMPIISNVTGERAGEEMADAAYWVEHVLAPVRFANGMEALSQEEVTAFVEVGPQPVLLGMGRQCLPEHEGLWLPSLRRGQDDWQQILQTLGQLYVQGADVDWAGFERNYNRRKVVLPTYPFERQRYWVDVGQNGSALTETGQKSTTVVELLNKGEVEQLAQEIQQADAFSEDEAQVLQMMVRKMVHRHHTQFVGDQIQKWFYGLEWRTLPEHIQEADSIEPKQPGHWLILADSSGTGDALATALQARGHTCSLARIGDIYDKHDDDYSINPSEREHFVRLSEDVLSSV
ncbi:MAG: type I polyketide synthase, partial [Halieaceae bacterium]|nr:type I polyketide synthase [Halieaceae bacterium]